MDLEAQASSVTFSNYCRWLLRDSDVIVRIVGWTIVAIGLGLVLGFVMVEAQPAAPGAPSACAGGVTVLLNGKPLSTGCTLNIVAGTGVIATPKADPAIGGTDISFAADLAYLQTLQGDESGTVHTLNATSGDSPGVTYIASLNPAMAQYTSGQLFVLFPDVPTQAGANLNIGGLGPVAIAGTCSKVCLIVGSGSPVSSFAVLATSATLAFGEVPAGTIDGNNVVFTLRHSPVAGYPVSVHRNGVRLYEINQDYVVQGSTITFVPPQIPQPSFGGVHQDYLNVDYAYQQ
jgi:hypothetical protein